jgi:tetratricopeptide (TPR) repeat protein
VAPAIDRSRGEPDERRQRSRRTFGSWIDKLRNSTERWRKAPGCCARINRRQQWTNCCRFTNRRQSNLDVAINLGGAYILLAKWNKAVRVLSKAAELHPDNAMLWSNLGAAHLGRLELAGPQQQQRAIRAYARALEVDPAVHNVNYHLGLDPQSRAVTWRQPSSVSSVSWR